MAKRHMRNTSITRSLEPLCGGRSLASDGPIVPTPAAWLKVPAKDRCGHCDRKLQAKAKGGRRK